MSLFQNLLGTMSTTLLVGGPSGIMLKKTSNGIEIRNQDGSALKDLTADNLIANTAVKADTISENTVGAGVTVGSVLLKNGLVDGVDIATLDSTVSGISSELTDINTGAGLNSNGTYKADTLANYIASASSLADADSKLDAQIHTNSTDISTIQGEIVKKDGTVAFTNDQSMGNHKITNLATPSTSTDAATKGYVDSVALGLTPHFPVLVATTAPLAVTPVGSGVGKTLTTNVNGGLVVDGVTLSLNDRVLVKNQASAIDNGVYTVTTVGDVSNPTVLTRATDFDGSAPNEVAGGDFVYVESGTNNINNAYAIISATTITVDTNDIVFGLVSTLSSIVAGDALKQTGDRFDVEFDNATIQLNGSNKLEVGSIANAQIASSAAIEWSKISKTSSSLADLATRAFSDLENIPAQIAFHGLTAASSLAGTEEISIFDGTSYLKTTVGAIINGLAIDTAVVHLAGAETITGVKDFSDGIKADTITPHTADGSVTVGGLAIQDGIIAATSVDIHNATAKTSATSSDELLIADSASSFAVKKITKANLLAGIASSNGISSHLLITVGTTTASSTTAIPEGAIIKSVVTSVATAYSSGATAQVLVNGSTPLVVQDTNETDLTATNVYESQPYANILAANAGTIEVVIAGSPSAGSCTVLVEYVPVTLS